ncbi:DUF6884 domain-containing protein [Streptomyces nigrescens]|uniref:DUF6884 domain-containing protein n=1 Tax=Streptomyces nigrescens TaxID=1920 RepID=UPI0036FC2F80
MSVNNLAHSAARSASAGPRLSTFQRAGLHAAAMHSEGHVPPSLAEGDLHQLSELGLIAPLAPRVPRPPHGPLARGPRYRITSAGRSRARFEPLPQVLLVPCSMRKADVPAAPAGEMYVGSYHQASRRAAVAAAGAQGQVLILSAKFGLLRAEDRIFKYDLRAGQIGTVTRAVLARQAHHLAVSAAAVTVLAGKKYADLARQVWPDLEHPLAGARGIGDHLAYFADLYAPHRRARTAGPQ